ncbi:MAG: penicillin-binding transpeptidase domain-containing protein [Alcanivoracaceae bacterium]|nr:penicillin-binding transpeptidase domain-containing protein [Alcanivoracaceae bacterium]
MKKPVKKKVGNTSLRFRFRFLVGFWLVCACLLVFRAVDLHVMQHDFLARQGDMRNLRIEPLAAHRGVITDRDGRPLAVSTPVTTLWANPREVIENREQWSLLAGNDVLDSAELARRVMPYSEREFIYLVRHLAPEQARKVLDAGVPGIYSLTEYRRYYPAGEVAGHIVGFTNIDDVGQEGIELSMEQTLRAHPGKKKVVRDLLGRVIQDIEILEPAHSGNDVRLSIDLRIQYLAYRELLTAVNRHKARGGSVVILDSRTGEILAMVNQPAYNPNNRAGLAPASLRNRAVTDVFEPGSTVKPLTVAAALEANMVTPRTSVDTRPGSIRVGSKTIRDHRNYGVIDITTVLTKSSNVGTTKLALSMDEHMLPALFEQFGFGHSTGIVFPGESDGMLPLRAQWRDIERAALSYGYGLSVTALQLAQAYQVLANDGVRMPLSMTRVSQPAVGERVLRADTARAIVSMLETVVSTEGTARRARVNGFDVAGKTGTVHKLTENGYADDRYTGLFAGVAPADDPQLVAVVVIDDPRGEAYYGGEVAAPVFSRIVTGALRAMHVQPEKTPGRFAGGDSPGGRT